MFGLIESGKPFVHAQWIVPLLSFQSDAAACYQSLEDDFTARAVPDLVMERVDFREGGWLSAKRVYLRLRRERGVLDFCSAPFGSGWYFSCRAVSLPRRLRGWEIGLTLLGMAGFFALYTLLFGVVTAGFVFGASGVFVLALFLSARDWAGLDEFLMYLPVAGAFYERYCRPDTYQRLDRRLAYASMVNSIIQGKVREFCLAGGVENPDFQDVKAPEQILSPRQLTKYFPRSPAGAGGGEP